MALNASPKSLATFGFEKIDGETIEVKSRFLTRLQSMRHDEICEAVSGKPIDDLESWTLLREAYELGAVSPTFDELQATLTDRDIVHLVMNYPTAVQIAEVELGKSKSRRLIHAGASAATVTAGDAPTLPASEAP